MMRRYGHFALTAALGLVLVCLAIPSSARAGTAPPAQHETVKSFLALARRAVSGTFSALYQVSQGSLSGTVDLAQQAAPSHAPFPMGAGRWSFVYQSNAGYSTQWIEKGPLAWDCRRVPTATTWTCSGPGPFEPSIGFSLAVVPFIPGAVLGYITQLVGGLTAHQVKGIRFSGPQVCASVLCSA